MELIKMIKDGRKLDSRESLDSYFRQMDLARNKLATLGELPDEIYAVFIIGSLDVGQYRAEANKPPWKSQEVKDAI